MRNDSLGPGQADVLESWRMAPPYSGDEISRRRDAVIRRMATTPPQPKATHRPKKKKKAVAGRAVRARCED
jgi:hypothetical protein